MLGFVSDCYCCDECRKILDDLKRQGASERYGDQGPKKALAGLDLSASMVLPANALEAANYHARSVCKLLLEIRNPLVEKVASKVLDSMKSLNEAKMVPFLPTEQRLSLQWIYVPMAFHNC